MTITGDRLRELRREKGKTLREVNVDTGISYSGLASIERGENSCNTSTLKILADYYDVPTDYLLGSAECQDISWQNKIKNLMLEKNITQNELAEALGITQATLSRNLSGVHRPKMEVIEGIASYFNISLDYLTGQYIPKNRLKELRVERNITLRELSEKVHIDYTALSRIETGNRSLTNYDIEALCNFFGVSSDCLLGLSNDNEQYVPASKSRLKELRIAKNLTIRELGLETNIAYSTISAMENGVRPFTQSNLEILCNYFNVSIDYLFCNNTTHPKDELTDELHNTIDKLNKGNKEFILKLAKTLIKEQ